MGKSLLFFFSEASFLLKDIFGILMQKRLEKALAEPTAALLDAATPDTWVAIKKLLVQETQTVKTGLLNAVSGFEMDTDEKESMVSNLCETGKRVIEKKASEEANQALIRMKER